MTINNFFIPNRQTVSAITQANPGVVTTTQAHGYETGLFVRFFFPLNVGMNQLKDKIVKITEINATSFSIDVDTSNFDVFNPVGTVQTPQVIPVAEQGSLLSQSVKNNDNITPEQ